MPPLIITVHPTKTWNDYPSRPRGSGPRLGSECSSVRIEALSVSLGPEQNPQSRVSRSGDARRTRSLEFDTGASRRKHISNRFLDHRVRSRSLIG